MLRKTLLLIIIFVTRHYFALAQECTDANVLSIPGQWKQGKKGASDHSAADMVKEKAIMDEVMQYIRSNLKWAPIGGDITYNNVYSINGQDYRPKPIINISNSYYTGMYFQHFYCGNGKISREDYSIEFRVQFNTIPFNFSESFFVSGKNKDGYDIAQDPGTDKYGFSEVLPIEKKGEFEVDEIAGKTSKYRSLTRTLIKQGKQPYRIMTKKEYYEKWKIKHQKEISLLEQSIADIAAREKELGNHDVSNTCLQTITLYKSYIHQIDALLQSKSAADLVKPAFGGEENGDFYENSTKEYPRNYVIKPDTSYYNKSLPKYSPQTITISFQYIVNVDNNGNESYNDEVFYKSITKSKIIDLLVEKLKTQIVE